MHEAVIGLHHSISGNRLTRPENATVCITSGLYKTNKQTNTNKPKTQGVSFWRLAGYFDTWRICTSVGWTSDRHAADASSIPRCGKGLFLPESAFSAGAHSLTCVRIPPPPCAITCINISAHVKDPIVYVRLPWIFGNTNTPSLHRRSHSEAAGFARAKQSEFQMGEITMGQYSYEK